ncbi:putative caffeoyl-CoA O-methyltransferase 1 [Dermacentor variabilis]|uniref:putative caffeoyl-CoA O-methyltransferase 1 n=1 Tax=Dermacentor variabilis TaxID=34621 RepID=UPI003F5BACE1
METAPSHRGRDKGKIATPEAEAYISEHCTLHPVLEKLIAETVKLPHGRMYTKPGQLTLYKVLLKATRAKKYLEVGVFTGCSALSAALALPPDGIVRGLDINQETADVGRPFWKEAGVERKIDIRIGKAVDTLDAMIADGEVESYDFAYIDADKEGYDDYYERCLKLVKRNGIIAFDNVLRGGSVFNAETSDPEALAMRALNTKLKTDERVQLAMLPFGDGVNIVLKK